MTAPCSVLSMMRSCSLAGASGECLFSRRSFLQIPASGYISKLFDDVSHLDAMNQRGAATDGGCNVDRLCHLLRELEPFLQTGRGVSVDAVRALDRVRHGQGNQ